MKRIIILGAGLSGLSAGWFLKQRFQESISLTILEQNNRAGGLIHTHQQDGFLFEWGPHSFRSEGGETTLELLKDLNLQKEILPCNPSVNRRFLFSNQQLKPLPYNLGSAILSPFTYQMVSGAIRDLFAATSNLEDETIQSFFFRRLGKTVTENLIDPMVSGIFAGDLSKLSIRSCFPKWHEYEKNRGSLLKGILKKKQSPQGPSSYTIEKGMESLPKKLATILEKHLRLSCGVNQIRFRSNTIEVLTATGEWLETDYLISTLPASSLQRLLHAEYPKISNLLEIPCASLVVGCLGYKKNILKKQGFGYLVPSKEKETILGAIWDSSIFPQQNQHEQETRLTVMLGGSNNPEIISFSNEKLYEMIKKGIQKHMGIIIEPDSFSLKKVPDAIPQYVVGHSKRVTLLEQNLKGLSPRFFCTGTAFRGVSLNDCIRNSKKLAAEITIDY